MKKIINLFLLLFLVGTAINGQTTTEQWNTYIAIYEENVPGSTTLRMDLINEAPFKEFPLVVITGVTYKTNRPDGFPAEETFEKLYNLQDALEALIRKEAKTILSGTFTFNKERLSYFYIDKDDGLKSKIENFYQKNYPDHEFYLNIKEDKNWETYRDFLYPNEETLNYMNTESVVLNLQDAGDPLTEERRVDHWLYFPTELDRNNCKTELIKQKYIVESEGKNAAADLPFKLHVWRIDKVDMPSIYAITSGLRMVVKTFNGEYDGWETSVLGIIEE